jgi:hypothetical protein
MTEAGLNLIVSPSPLVTEYLVEGRRVTGTSVVAEKQQQQNNQIISE